MKTPLWLGLGALMMAAPLLADHRDDRRDDDRRRGRGRVIVYQHANFGGDVLVLYPGDEIENMSGQTFENGAKLNDSISSIRVEGNVEVFVYENARYRGDALRLTENARDLTGRPVKGSVSVNWNDRISSLRVGRVSGWDRNPGRPDEGGPRNNPDRSIKAAFNDLLGREPSAGELRDFRVRMIDEGWNERMLRDHLRTEEQYRNEAAEMIVRRAYRDVLGREVDPSGLKQYSWAVREKGWTESDVRDDLRKSAEFRNKPRN
ncbi:MAG TPA: peptidase inhibitor family I36 protein [Lacunisphaera sp.]